MTDTVLKLKEVLARTKRGRSSTLAAVKAGEFPAPFKIDGRSLAWMASDIDAWLSQRIADTRAVAPRPSYEVAQVTETSRRLTAANTALNDEIHAAVVPAIIAAASSQPAGMCFKHYSDATAKAVMPDLKASSADVIALRSEREQAMLAIVRAGVRARLSGWMGEAVAAEIAKPYKSCYQQAKAWANAEAAQLRALTDEAVFERVAADLPMIEGPRDE